MKLSVAMAAMALVCGAVATSAARASSLDLYFTGDNPGVDGGLKVTFTGGTQSAVDVGQMDWIVFGGNTAGYSFGQHVATYCIQGRQSVSSGNIYDYNVVNLNSANVPNGGLDQGVLDSLAAQQIQGLANSYFATAGQKSGSYTADETAAAFQLAIWEIEYDGGTGKESFPQTSGYNFFSHGLVEATGTDSEGIAAINLANSWLENFTASSAVNSLALTSSSSQDQFIFNPTTTGGGSQVTVAPLPAAFPAGFALLGGLFGARKLKKKQA